MTVKTKILYLITKSNWGGAQKYVYDLATTMPADQYEIAVAFGGTGEMNASAGRLKAMLDEARIRSIFIPNLTRNIYPLKEILGFRSILKVLWQEKPNILHLNSSKAAGVGAFWGRLLGIKKIIYTVHGWPFNDSRSLSSRTLIYLFTWLTCLLSHQIIVISHEDYETGGHLWGQQKKMRLIHNGLKPIIFLPRTEARAKLAGLAHINISNDEIIGGTIAELHPNKNLSTLIDAFTYSSRKPRLIIIGAGEEEQKLRGHIERHGLSSYIFLFGFVPEAASYLAAFDFFILPSLKEGQPYVLLEAGLAGLPVIGSDIPSITDIIAPAAGIVVPAKSSIDLGQAIDKLAINPELRTELGQNLRIRVKDNYSWEKMLNQTTSLYQ
jgi:glycosyltransferase involved in cell wall biosynthesis